jgi:hypothetical protein
MNYELLTTEPKAHYHPVPSAPHVFVFVFFKLVPKLGLGQVYRRFDSRSGLLSCNRVFGQMDYNLANDLLFTPARSFFEFYIGVRAAARMAA